MKLLLTGATGFIGSRLRTRLLAAGHEVVCAGRQPPGIVTPGAGRVQIDFAQALAPAHWLPHLQGMDAAINTVGLFRERGAQTFDALHHRAPLALFQACVQAGVPRVIQLSALGVEAALTAYQRSKLAADEALLALPLDATIARPSLVFGEDGPSARFFLSLSSLPLLALPGSGPLQPVHVDDVVEALVALVAAAPGTWRAQVVPLVGPAPLDLRAYLQALRRAQDLPPALVLPVPAPLAATGARIAGRLGSSLLDADSWTMLQQGHRAGAAAITRLLGRPPRRPEDFIAPPQRTACRTQSVLAWALPLLRGAIAAVWLLTALVSAGLYPVSESYALLARTGLPPALQPLMLHGAVALDALLGLLTLWPLHPRPRRWLWLAQIALIGFYTGVISLRLPEFWLHPYGPLSKNLPMLAALLLLLALEPLERRRWNT